MNHKTIFVTAVLTALALLPAGLAQELVSEDTVLLASVGSDLPGKLEDMLLRALQSNPDMLVAETRLRQAEAELNQVRLEVTQLVAILFIQRNKLLQLGNELSARVGHARKMVASGAASSETISEAVLAKAETDAELARTEAELRYVLGLGGSARPPAPRRVDTATSIRTAVPPTRPGIPDDMSRLLQKPISVKWEDVSIKSILQELQEATGNELGFMLSPEIVEDADDYGITLSIPREIELGAALVAITDYFRDSELCFVFRDYGVLLTYFGVAQDMNSATVPPDVPFQPRRQ